jgi:hypothetical protein
VVVVVVVDVEVDVVVLVEVEVVDVVDVEEVVVVVGVHPLIALQNKLYRLLLFSKALIIVVTNTSGQIFVSIFCRATVRESQVSIPEQGRLAPLYLTRSVPVLYAKHGSIPHPTGTEVTPSRQEVQFEL